MFPVFFFFFVHFLCVAQASSLRTQNVYKPGVLILLLRDMNLTSGLLLDLEECSLWPKPPPYWSYGPLHLRVIFSTGCDLLRTAKHEALHSAGSLSQVLLFRLFLSYL